MLYQTDRTCGNRLLQADAINSGAFRLVLQKGFRNKPDAQTAADQRKNLIGGSSLDARRKRQAVLLKPQPVQFVCFCLFVKTYDRILIDLRQRDFAVQEMRKACSADCGFLNVHDRG